MKEFEKWREGVAGFKNILKCCRVSGKRVSFQGTSACSAIPLRGFESVIQLGAIFFL